jgi:hypothetical protein
MSTKEKISKMKKIEQNIYNIEKKIAPLDEERQEQDWDIKEAGWDSDDEVAKKLRRAKIRSSIILITLTVLSGIIVYFTFPFGMPNPSGIGGETHGIFGLVCVYIVHIVAIAIGIYSISEEI